MSLPNPGMSVTSNTPALASDINDIIENVESLANGTGLDNGSISTAKLTTAAAAIGNYSTSEVATGYTYIDGKTIYRKTINFGALPNNTTKSVAHGITLQNVMDIQGITTNGSGLFLKFPHGSTSSMGNQITITINGANIDVVTGTDRTAFITTYITIFYTKP